MAQGSIGGFLPLSGGTVTGALGVPVGAAALPGIFQAGTPGSGIWFRTTSTVNVSPSGSNRWEFGTSYFTGGSSTVIGFVSSAAPGGNPDTGLSRVSAGIVAVGTGSQGSTAGTMRAAALAAGGSDFTVTAANSVSPTSPNRTITISYGGTTYYLAAKTTND